MGSHLVDMNAPATLVSFLVCYAALCGALPAPEGDAAATDTTNTAVTPSESSAGAAQGKHETSVVASSHTVSAANGLVVSITERKDNDKCVSKLTIEGHGINKTVDYPCGQTPQDIINLKDGLAVGDEWYTDEPKTLIHITGNQCQKELFTEQDGKITSTSQSLSDEECKKVHDKLSELKEKQKEWKNWLIKQEEEAKKRLDQMQQNISQMFGNIFGGK